MKTLTLEIGGKELPCRMTMGAMLMFKHLRGKDVSQMAEGDLEDMLALMYCCLKSACRAESVDMAMSFEEFCDRITPDDLNAWNKQMAEADEAKKKKP